MISSSRNIIIIGGGVGGLQLVTKLCKKLDHKKQAKVTLVDQNPRYLWKPMLHEVAAGSLDEDLDSVNYLIHSYNYRFQFQLGSLIQINRDSKTITVAPCYNSKGKLLIPERKLPYDTLVMALGSTSNDFNIPGIKEHCIFLDNLHQACRFRQEMMDVFLRYSSRIREKNKIDIAIVGGGATGVELSAELHNAIKQLHRYGYKELTNHVLNVTLIEASERILPALPFRTSSAVHKKLTALGVQIITQTLVSGADKSGLYTQERGHIQADLMVWAAGIKAPDFMKNIGGLETNNINQLIVRSTLQTTRDPDIFAIGDCASCSKPEGGVVPARAQAAHQMANLALHNILAQMQGRELKAYIYRDHGALVSLSSYSTVGYLMSNLVHSSIEIEGYIARLIYFFLYRKYQTELYGYLKTILITLVDIVNRIIRPCIKMD